MSETRSGEGAPKKTGGADGAQQVPDSVSFARSWRIDGRAESTIDGSVYVLSRFADHLGGETALITTTRHQLENYLKKLLGTCKKIEGCSVTRHEDLAA